MMKVISLRNDAETVFHPLSKSNMSQDSKCMSETVGTTKSYIHYVFSYTFVPMIRFDLY